MSSDQDEASYAIVVSEGIDRAGESPSLKAEKPTMQTLSLTRWLKSSKLSHIVNSKVLGSITISVHKNSLIEIVPSS